MRVGVNMGGIRFLLDLWLEYNFPTFFPQCRGSVPQPLTAGSCEVAPSPPPALTLLLPGRIGVFLQN